MIISLTAAVIIFLFYRINTMEERFFSAPLKVKSPPDMAIANPYPSSVRITLRGEADSIFHILDEDIEVLADFDRYETEGEYRVPLRVVRKGTALNIEPLEIKVEPPDIMFTLELKMEKSVDVAPVIKGIPAHGYELVQYSITPRMVEIAGPRSLVQRINGLMSEEIDLSGRTEDFSERVRIGLDSSFVHLTGATEVRFRGIIREAEIIKTFEPIALISIDLSPSLKLSATLPSGSIKLQGGQNAIEQLTLDQLRVVVDCGNITLPGEYILNPEPDTPLGYVVLKYLPRQLSLTFVQAPGEGSGE
ncbi:hypothetical protein ES703_106199 [subsurface metagenome]